MPHQECYFAGHDGLQLYQQQWLPEAPATAAVLVVHGFCEHSGRYAALAAALNQRGYAVYAMDHRGHGRSAGRRAAIHSFDEYLADLDIFLERVRAAEPDVPLFLLGHSMGGTIVALFAVTRQPHLRGLVLSGAALWVGRGMFPVLRHLAALLGRLLPGLRLVRMGSKFICRDPQARADFENDPLVLHGRFPVRTGAEILRACRWIQAQMEAVRLPLLILHGTDDLAAEAEGGRQLHLRSASTDKTLHLYDGLYHDVFHEPEKDRVTADLIAWLNQRRKPAG